MKKIFLSIMMVLMIALPAFAQDNINTEVYNAATASICRPELDQKQIGGAVMVQGQIDLSLNKGKEVIKGVGQISIAGSAGKQEMEARNMRTSAAQADNYYYYGYAQNYGQINMQQNQNEQGKYSQTLSGAGFTMTQSGKYSSSQSQYINVYSQSYNHGYYY